jgi:acyl-CoA thioesterase
LAVVSTLSSFESLISPSHWLKKNSSSNIPKKFHQPRKLKMKFKIWEQSMQGDQNSNTQRVNIPPSQNLELQPQKHSVLLSDYPRIQAVTQ